MINKTCRIILILVISCASISLLGCEGPTDFDSKSESFLTREGGEGASLQDKTIKSKKMALVNGSAASINLQVNSNIAQATSLQTALSNNKTISGVSPEPLMH